MALDLDITVRARHIPGCLNVIADRLSRPNQPIMTEWSLHPKVIQKLRTTKTGELILIAPWWPSQPWFPHLLRLSVDHLLRFFQYRRDLLSQQGYISSGKSYDLHTWRLLCSTTKQQDFQGRSLSLPQLLHVGDPPQIEYTMTGGYASLPGLQGEDLIKLSRVTGPV